MVECPEGRGGKVLVCVQVRAVNCATEKKTEEGYPDRFAHARGQKWPGRGDDEEMRLGRATSAGELSICGV